MKKQIQLDVLPDGSYQIKPIGYPGKSCKTATAPIEQALGIVDEGDRRLLPEYSRPVGFGVGVEVEDQSFQTC